MPQQKMVRAIYHDGTLQLLEPVDFPDGAEVQILLPMRHDMEWAIQGPAAPTRPYPPETLCRVRGLLAVGGNALVDSEALYDDRCA